MRSAEGGGFSARSDDRKRRSRFDRFGTRIPDRARPRQHEADRVGHRDGPAPGDPGTSANVAAYELRSARLVGRA